MKIRKESITLRRHIKEKIENSEDEIVDLEDVEFISRAVADELCHQVDNNNIRIINADGDVKEILWIISEDQDINNLFA